MSNLTLIINGKNYEPYISDVWSKKRLFVSNEVELLDNFVSENKFFEIVLTSYAGKIIDCFELFAKEYDVHIISISMLIDGNLDLNSYFHKKKVRDLNLNGVHFKISLNTNSDGELENLIINQVLKNCPFDNDFISKTTFKYLKNKDLFLN